TNIINENYTDFPTKQSRNFLL
uniref:Uncharacterized protein n=1 Tax=Panagrolaimus sp. PS1159 TaxID=55785 RepID=A0AC35G776_9BILA